MIRRSAASPVLTGGRRLLAKRRRFTRVRSAPQRWRSLGDVTNSARRSRWPSANGVTKSAWRSFHLGDFAESRAQNLLFWLGISMSTLVKKKKKQKKNLVTARALSKIATCPFNGQI